MLTWRKWLKDKWCRIFHSDVYWPAHGKYVCKTCGNEFEAPLELNVIDEIRDQVDLVEEVEA